LLPSALRDASVDLGYCLCEVFVFDADVAEVPIDEGVVIDVEREVRLGRDLEIRALSPVVDASDVPGSSHVTAAAMSYPSTSC
jgi:hypothetical protein